MFEPEANVPKIGGDASAALLLLLPPPFIRLLSTTCEPGGTTKPYLAGAM
eukprot:COSAG06_NODE_56374_length_285_cov_0.655914_1_plen_49_part_10